MSKDEYLTTTDYEVAYDKSTPSSPWYVVHRSSGMSVSPMFVYQDSAENHCSCMQDAVDTARRTTLAVAYQSQANTVTGSPVAQRYYTSLDVIEDTPTRKHVRVVVRFADGNAMTLEQAAVIELAQTPATHVPGTLVR